MAKYTKTNWLEILGTKLNRFLKQNESLTHVELTLDPETVTQAGTYFSASLMTNMETGIEKHDQTLGFNMGAVSLTALGQTSRNYRGMATTSSGNVYVVDGAQLYKQTAGAGSFVSMGLTVRTYLDIEAVGNDLYLTAYGAGVYKVTNETGDAVLYANPTNNKCSAIACDGIDMYISTIDGGTYATYKQTGMTGSFVSVVLPSPVDNGLIIFGGSCYASSANGLIYKQTNKTGSFFSIGAPAIQYSSATTDGIDLFFNAYNGSVIKYRVSANVFANLYLETASSYGVTFLNGLLYRAVASGDIYKSTSLYQDASIYATKNVALLHDDAPIGARKRIFNTGSASLDASAWNATIDGASTVTVPAGGFIEIEKTGAGTFIALSEIVGGRRYKDFVFTMPSAGASSAGQALGFMQLRIRFIEGAVINYTVAVTNNHIEADGTRTAHFGVYSVSDTLYIQSDATISTGLVGQQVAVRVWITP